MQALFYVKIRARLWVWLKNKNKKKHSLKWENNQIEKKYCLRFTFYKLHQSIICIIVGNIFDSEDEMNTVVALAGVCSGEWKRSQTGRTHLIDFCCFSMEWLAGQGSL